ncbi:MAG: ribose-phosphate pyrophosphokinase, partial [Bacteroidota bacterium]
DLVMRRGAKSVRALATHPLLSGSAYETIENSVIEELFVCDTIPLRRKSPKIKVLSSADLFAQAIRNAHENESISALFV